MRALFSCAIALTGCSTLLGVEPLGSGDAGTSDSAPGVDAAPHYSLTVRKAADGTGEGAITAAAIGLDCGAGCATQTIVLAGPAAVEVQVAPSSGTFFQGWSGPCHGPARRCTIQVDGDVEVGARLTSITQNLMFATAAKFGANLGGVAGADQKCADAAQAAGLAGIWVAVVSVENGDNAPDHLLMSAPGQVGGWIRLDGAPVADDLAALVNDQRLFYPVAFDELGNRIPADDDEVWTGSNARMFWSGASCGDWAATTGTGTVGAAARGPGQWMASRTSVCTATARLYCAMVNRSTTVAPPAPTAGKKIYISNADVAFGPAQGTSQADAACVASAPTGVTSAHALLATNSRAAAALLDPAATYVRPDGVAVGTGADLIAASAGERVLEAAPWQTGGGLYASTDQEIWSGSATLAGLGNSGTTCSDWAVGANKANTGQVNATSAAFWSGRSARCDATGVRALCVED
ncbi:MAG: hypothetical protein K8W52_43585 [Deltaproteobacteria bacterium]|nr:hypothetical protein [Deltaproteobacteria bacterium]